MSFLILYKIKEIPLRTSWPPKEVGGLSMLYEEADPDSQSVFIINAEPQVLCTFGPDSRDAQEQSWAASAIIL